MFKLSGKHVRNPHYCQLKEVLSLLMHNSKLGTVIHDLVAFGRDLILLCGISKEADLTPHFQTPTYTQIYPLPTDQCRKKKILNY